MMRQQLPGMAGVFTSNPIRRTEDFQCPQRDVGQVADRRLNLKRQQLHDATRWLRDLAPEEFSLPALQQGRRLLGHPASNGTHLAALGSVPVALVEAHSGEVRVLRGFNLIKE